MKKLLLTLLTLSSSLLVLHAQSWLWAREGHNGKSKASFLNAATSAAMDKYHDVYETGRYDGDTIIFSNDTLLGPPYQTYLVKYDDNGNVLWAESSWTNANNASQFVIAECVVADSKDNAYITGQFADTTYFKPFELTSPAHDWNNTFLVKYDENGNVKWAEQSVTYTHRVGDIGLYLALDKSEKFIYETGGYQDSISFGSYKLKGTFNSNAFLVKYDSNGSVIWAKQGINSVQGNSESYSVVTDNMNNIYITGYYVDSITFGSQTLTCGIYQSNQFIVKFDSGGNVIWAKQAVIPTGNSGSWGNALGKDNSGNIYVTGYFYDTLSLGATTLISPYPLSQCVYWAKYDTDGNVKWARQAHELDSLQWEGWSIQTDNKNELYLGVAQGGRGKAKIIFNTDTLQGIVRNGLVWLKFDSNGNVLNSYIFPSGSTPQVPNALDSLGCYVYLGGTISDTTTIVFGSDTVGSSFNTFISFIARWSPGECTENTGINSVENPIISFNIYPNPTEQYLNLNFNKQPDGPATLSIMDITGRIVVSEQLSVVREQMTVDVASLASGMYFINLKTQDLYVTQKFIKL